MSLDADICTAMFRMYMRNKFTWRRKIPHKTDFRCCPHKPMRNRRPSNWLRQWKHPTYSWLRCSQCSSTLKTKVKVSRHSLGKNKKKCNYTEVCNNLRASTLSVSDCFCSSIRLSWFSKSKNQIYYGHSFEKEISPTKHCRWDKLPNSNAFPCCACWIRLRFISCQRHHLFRPFSGTMFITNL